jgi:uncharacterized membrane protein YdjX (TVP38/TMEM64 family)
MAGRPVSREIDQTEPCRAVVLTPRSASGRWAFVLLMVAVIAFVVWAGWHRQVSLETLVRHRATIDEFVAQHRLAAILGFIAIYAMAVTLSFPGAMALTICGGVMFGGLTGGFAAIAAATLGAIGIFLITRRTFSMAAGDPEGTGALTRHAGPLAAKLAAGFREDAFCYLMFLRLVPIFPYWLVNLVPAMCGVRLGPFVAATMIGVIPASFAYAFFGSGLDSIVAAQARAYDLCVAAHGVDCHVDFNLKAAATPQLMAGLVALGLVALIPLAIKKFRATRAGAAPRPVP